MKGVYNTAASKVGFTLSYRLCRRRRLRLLRHISPPMASCTLFTTLTACSSEERMGIIKKQSSTGKDAAAAAGEKEVLKLPSNRR